MIDIIGTYVKGVLAFVFQEAEEAEEDAIEAHRQAADAAIGYHEARIVRIRRTKERWLGVSTQTPAAPAPAPAPAASARGTVG